MSTPRRIILIIACILAFFMAIPWSTLGMKGLDFLGVSDYKLGLDLHGGVELDYLVDFSQATEEIDETQVVEDLKVIIDGRVRNLGSSEPTLITANYGDETHLIVQIPTPNWGSGITQEERDILDQEYIQEAKNVIGKVVKIQFKEPRPADEYEQGLQARSTLLSDIEDRILTSSVEFPILVNSVVDSYENVFTDSEILTLDEVSSTYQIALPEDFESPIYRSEFFPYELNGQSGNMMVYLSSIDGDNLTQSGSADVTTLFVDDLPLTFRPARGSNGEILDERYLINTVPTAQPTGQYVISLMFNAEGQKMFGDITGRNIGGSIAIFLGNELLTNPGVSERIIGNAIITPGYESDTKAWATELSHEINEGIVPVPIYQHSERTIGPNLGKSSLEKLVFAGLIGFVLIAVFLIWQYGKSGFIAALCLIVYIFFLLAFVRFFGVVLTLSGVAGIVLSLGMAIDANILILERVREQLDSTKDIRKALKTGFEESWAAIWDANITGLLVGLVLWWAGVSLIKGFGIMLVLGILISLFVVKSVCMPLTRWSIRK